MEIQSVPTASALDWEHFAIAGEHYLAVANYRNNTTYNLNSKIYKWSGSAFVEVQSIATNGAIDSHHFEIAGKHYLAVANSFNEVGFNIDSRIYQWNGFTFVT